MYSQEREMEKIANEWRMLENQWRITTQYWKDSARQRFAREFWNERETLMPAYMKKLHETLDLISRMHREL